jgi:hypothetical protein
MTKKTVAQVTVDAIFSRHDIAWIYVRHKEAGHSRALTRI